jgi:fluoride exporter
MLQWQKLLLIALAGSLGTLARYSLDGLVQQFTDRFAPFPWGIVVVNLSGCFIFGILASLFGERSSTSGEMRAILLTGFLGAFTTFSTYIFELEQMLQDWKWLPAAGNFAVHNIGGLAAIIAGLILGKLL